MPKFKIGDRVRIGTRGFGYDIALIEQIDDVEGICSYHLKVLTRNGYLNERWLDQGTDTIRYVYPLGNWEMEYADNTLQRLKKRHSKR